MPILLIFLLAQFQRTPMPHDRQWNDYQHFHYEVPLKTNKHGAATIRYKDLYPLESYKGVPVSCTIERVPGDKLWTIPIYATEDAEHITIKTKPFLEVPMGCDIAVKKKESEAQ